MKNENEIENFMMRIGDIEARTCDEQLMRHSKKHTTIEILKWHKDNKTCHVMAFWKRKSECYDLHFVGRRPFDDCDANIFFKVAKIGQKHLDEYFEITEF